MKNKLIMQSLSAWKTEIISSAMVLLCLLLFVFFPTQGVLQNFSKNFLFLLILPIFYIKLVLKKTLADFGFNLRNPRLGFVWATMMLVVSILIISILFNLFDFANNYPVPAYLANNFWLFLFYEFVLVNLVLFINEFFFKGFLLSFLTRRFGFLAAIIQALIYILFILTASNAAWRIAPTIILSFTGGITAYKTRSFVYSYLMSLIFMLFLDAYIIHIFK